MRYEIIGKTVPAVEFTLNRGESIYSQRGGMTWQTDGINMKTNARGGSNEKSWQNVYWRIYFYEYIYCKC